MSVSAVYAPVLYLGTGGTLAFDFPYQFFAPSDLVVSLFDNGAAAPVQPAPVLNGTGTYDYTVTGTLDPNLNQYLGGGAITFNTAPAPNWQVILKRSTSVLQPDSYPSNGPFPASTVEQDQDRAILLLQEAEAGTARAILAPDSDPPGLNMTLPPVAARALRVIGFGVDGSVQLVDPTFGPVTSADNVSYKAPYNGSIARVLTAKLDDVVSVLDFGAVADWTGTAGTDNTTAFQNALSSGQPVFVPAGSYYIAGRLAMTTDGQVLYGESAAPAGGSRLVFGPGAAECITLGSLSDPQLHLKGFWLRDLALDCSQRQGTPGVPAASAPGSVTTNATAISTYNTGLARLDNININGAWNGVYCCGNVRLAARDVIMTLHRGDFGWLETAHNVNFAGGNSAGTNLQVESYIPVSHQTTGPLTAGTHIIPIDDVSTIWPGFLIRQRVGAAITAGTPVTAVDRVANTVTIGGAGLLDDMTGGQTLYFYPPTIGFWFSSYFSGFQGVGLRGGNLYTLIKTDDPIALSGSAPSDIVIAASELALSIDFGDGDSIGDMISIGAGNNIALTEPQLIGGAARGRGVYFDPSASNLRILGGRVTGCGQHGLDLQGDGAQILGTVIAQNGQAASATYDGISVAATASQVIIADCVIGKTAAGSGQQRYGVNNLGAPAADVLIEGCDLRGNNKGAVNDPSLFVSGVNVGLSRTPAWGLIGTRTQYFLAQAASEPPRAMVNAYDDLVRGLISGGLWALCDVLLIFAANDATTALINLKNPYPGPGNPLASSHGSVGFTAQQGFQGDGSTGYIDFGLTPAQLTNFSLNSASLYVWAMTDIEGATFGDISDLSGSQAFINGRNNSGNLATQANAATVGTDAVANSTGFYGWSRQANGSYNTHKNGSVLSTHSIAATVEPTGDFAALVTSTRRLAMAWIGAGLTDAQVLALYNLFLAYMTNL